MTRISTCEYVKRDGVCGRTCYDGRCWQHKTRMSHRPCHNGCGRGTLSQSGYCRTCADNNGGLQATVTKQIYRGRKKLEAEWDAYIVECMKSADSVLDLSGEVPPAV